jgi:hypothetical protein
MKRPVVLLIAVLSWLVIARSALGRASVLASGHIRPFSWQITAGADRTGKAPRRGYCIDFSARLGGPRTSRVGEECFSPGDVHRDGATGVISFGSRVGAQDEGRTRGVRARGRPSRRVVITLRSGRVLRAPTHALPERLHAGARLAWVVEAVPALSASRPGVEALRVTAYDRAGRVVGSL